jgi:hypothetical protein
MRRPNQRESHGVNPHDFVDFFYRGTAEENFDRCTEQRAVLLRLA